MGLFILFGVMFSSKDNIIFPVASPTQICVQADADTLQQVWMKPTKTIKGLEHVMCEESSENCFGKSQEKARDGGDLTAVSNPDQSTQKRRHSQTILKGALTGQVAYINSDYILIKRKL